MIRWTDRRMMRWTEIDASGRHIERHAPARSRAMGLTVAILVVGAALISFSMGWGIHGMIHKDDHVGEIGKAKAYDSHCNLMRFAVDGMRRDLWRGRIPALQYRDLAMHDFENANVCMIAESGDPVFFPQSCFADDPVGSGPELLAFKSCVLNQLDMLLLVMR